jgi:multidrug efflux pump subunit AcrA (membrane-fusion protein)
VIESADNRLHPATGSLALRLVFPNEDGALVSGLFARVRADQRAAARAPDQRSRAVGTDQKFVLALGDNNTVQYRTVKLGGSVDGKRIVRDGLKPGDQIVVNGLQRVRPSMQVAPEQLATTESATAPSTPAKVASAEGGARYP